MSKYRVSNAMRLFLFGASAMIWAGIWLTGFEKAHWLLYWPAAFFTFAAATGICPGMILTTMIFRNKDEKPQEK